MQNIILGLLCIASGFAIAALVVTNTIHGAAEYLAVVVEGGILLVGMLILTHKG